MNRFINALLLFIFLPILILSIYVGFDLPLDTLHTTGARLPYKTFIFFILGLLVCILVLRRTVRRWMGIYLVLKTSKFVWNQPVGEERLKRVTVYTLMEAFVFLGAGLGLYLVNPLAWLPAIGFFFVTLDNTLFLLVGKWKNAFRLGVTTKALILADREVLFFYFNGLRKVTVHQDSVYFDYIHDLQLNFPLDAVNQTMKASFFNQLRSLLDKDKVLFRIKAIDKPFV